MNKQKIRIRINNDSELKCRHKINQLNCGPRVLQERVPYFSSCAENFMAWKKKIIYTNSRFKMTACRHCHHRFIRRSRNLPPKYMHSLAVVYFLPIKLMDPLNMETRSKFMILMKVKYVEKWRERKNRKSVRLQTVHTFCLYLNSPSILLMNGWHWRIFIWKTKRTDSDDFLSFRLQTK